jgi:hypothetical protein
MARSAQDGEISQDYLNLARAYRSQADALKAKHTQKNKQKRK